MDILSISIAAATGLLANKLYDLIKTLISRSSKNTKISVKMPSGQEFEIDAPSGDDERFNSLLRMFIYSTEPVSISKKDGVNLLRDVVMPSSSVVMKGLGQKNIRLKIENLESIKQLKR